MDRAFSLRVAHQVVVISKYGYVRHEDGMISSTFAQKFGGIIQLERWRVAHKKEEFWLIAKFAAEKDMWSLYPSKFKFSDKNTYDEYVHKIILFIEKWYDGTGAKSKFIKTLLLDPTMQNYEHLKSKYPPAKPVALRLRPPQRGLTAIV